MRKPLGEFHNCKSAWDGKQSKCKKCQAELQRLNRPQATANHRAYRERHGEQLKRKEREYTLQAKYGLTLEKFDEVLAAQGGVCASCGEADLGKGNWHVDHDHSCCSGARTCGNCICGILCPGCNKGIGMFKDSPDRLLAAAAYLMQTRAINTLNQS